MIHVCFGLCDKDGRYSKFTGTAMTSLFENTTSDVTIHILHDETLTDDNRDKFIWLAGKYSQQIKFYNVEKLCAEKIDELRKSMQTKTNFKLFTMGTLYRLLATYIFSDEIKKVLYLDSDIVVNLDVKKIWNIDLGEKIFAAASEVAGTKIPAKNYLPLCRDGLVEDENYFNSGVLLMNLDQLRKEKETLEHGLKFISENPQYAFFDQDILNYCFSARIIKLPTDFNRFVVHSRLQKDFRTDDRICHYISSPLGRGLTLDTQDNFNRLWFKYFSKTAWFHSEIFEHLSESVTRLYSEQKSFAVKISEMMSGRKRAFFTTSGNADAVKKIFSVRADEEIILDSPEKIIKSMKKSGGKKLFFIIVGNYSAVVNQLRGGGVARR